MRKFIFIFFILLMSISSVYATEQVVEFDNTEVEEVVRKLIYKPTGPIYQSDIRDIRSIGSENYKNIPRLEQETRDKFGIVPSSDIQLNIIRFLELEPDKKEYHGEFAEFYTRFLYVFNAKFGDEWDEAYRNTTFESEEFKQQCKQWDAEWNGKVRDGGIPAKIDYAARVFAKKTLDKIITPNMTDLEKIKAIYDHMSYNWEYDYEQILSQTGKGWSIKDNPLLIEKGVCGAYSYGFEVYCDVAGIESMSVGGWSSNRSHGWNLVKLDGKWYHCDPTWDTYTSLINGFDEVSYYLYRGMFLVSDEDMKKQDPTREWATEKYPVCNETYKGQQGNIEVLDKEKIKVLNNKERRKIELHEAYGKYDSKKLMEIAKKKIRLVDEMLEKGTEYQNLK